jgi:hypothetical protein
MSQRKGKDKEKVESKPPYFDFSLLASRPFQVAHMKHGNVIL